MDLDTGMEARSAASMSARPPHRSESLIEAIRITGKPDSTMGDVIDAIGVDAAMELAGGPRKRSYRSATYDDPPSEASILLRHPFTLNGQRYDRIDLQPPAFGDVQAVHRGEIAMLDLYARMAGVSVDVLDALRWDDSERVSVNAQLLAPCMVKA